MSSFDDIVANDRGDARPGSTAVQIANEFVRSFGFKGDPQTGDWSWSIDNVMEAIREHPFLTAIDYITLAVPVAKWGVAAARVMKGSGAVARAYEAGEFGERGVRALNKAVRLEQSLPPRSRIAQKLYSPVNIDKDAVEIIRKYGGGDDPRDRRALAFFIDRERRAMFELVRRSHAEVQLRARRVDPEMGERVTRLMEISPTDNPDEWGAAWKHLDRRGQDLYTAQFRFRNWLHESSYHYGLISEETYKRNLERYVPRGYEEFENILRETRIKIWGTGHRVPWEEGARHYLPRTADEHPDLTRILDPRYATDQMARASMVVTQQAYAIGLAKNGLIKSADEVDELVRAGQLAPDERDKWVRLIDLFPGKAKAKKSARLRQLEARERALARREKAHLRMWRTTEDVLLGQTGKVIGMRMAEVERYRRARSRLGRLSARKGRMAEDSRALGQPEAALVDQATRELGDARVATARHAQRALDLGAEIERLATGDRSAWKRMKRHLAKEGRKLERERMKLAETLARERELAGKPIFLKRLPNGQRAAELGLLGRDGRPLDLANALVDPAIADDIRGIVDLGTQNPIIAMYQGALRWFKVSHTAYNPATQSRNFLGNAIFHMLATGIRGFPAPVRGIRSWRAQGDEFYEALEAGVLGGGVDKIAFDEWTRIYEPAAGEGVADWIRRTTAGSAFTKAVKASDEKARRLYMAGDEVWKLDAWLKLRDRYTKKLAKSIDDKTRLKERATELATLDVMRYFPNYLQTSPLTDMMRNVIPFFGFTSEAVRVWKNAMTFRPHVAFFLQRWAEIGSHTLAAMAGLEESEIEAARTALPHYAQNKKMLLWPFRDGDRKVSFLDLSYIMPGAEIGAEAESSESLFWGVPVPTSLANFGANPFLGLFAAGLTGIDPFTKRPIAPRFTERALDVPITGENERWAVGMGEYMARAMLPPLVPPNYVGMNLWDAARGTKSGVTGEELQKEVSRTIAANLFGLRTYEPTVGAQITNLRREQRITAGETSAAWDRWEMAMANGHFDRAAAEQRRIIELKGQAFFFRNFKKHLPGSYGNMGRADIEEVVRRSLTFQADPNELWPVWARFLELQRNQ